MRLLLGVIIALAFLPAETLFAQTCHDAKSCYTVCERNLTTESLSSRKAWLDPSSHWFFIPHNDFVVSVSPNGKTFVYDDGCSATPVFRKISFFDHPPDGQAFNIETTCTRGQKIEIRELSHVTDNSKADRRYDDGLAIRFYAESADMHPKDLLAKLSNKYQTEEQNVLEALKDDAAVQIADLQSALPHLFSGNPDSILQKLNALTQACITGLTDEEQAYRQERKTVADSTTRLRNSILRLKAEISRYQVGGSAQPTQPETSAAVISTK